MPRSEYPKVLAVKKLIATRYNPNVELCGNKVLGKYCTKAQSNGRIGISLHNVLGSVCLDNVGIIKN